MKNILLSVAVALSAASFMANAQVNTFEDIGTVQSVQLGTNLIGVNDTFYKLPNAVQVDGASAILQLKPGYLVGFSGTGETPYNLIDSLYLYLESVLEVETNSRTIQAPVMVAETMKTAQQGLHPHRDDDRLCHYRDFLASDCLFPVMTST